MAIENKYVVLKKEDWEAFKTYPGATPKFPTPLDGCVVLRYQDIFTASALYEYAGLVTTVVEVMKQTGLAKDELSGYDVESLEELARTFMSLGDEATEWKIRKIPD